MNPELGFAPDEIEDGEKPDIRVRDVESFETEKGSVYHYDSEGQTQRFKTATKELHEPQDLTVFIDGDERQINRFLESIHLENNDRERSYVVERRENDQPVIIRNYDEIENPDRVYLALIKNGQFQGALPASLRPKIGSTVFDMSSTIKNGERITTRHLGHKVTKITPR